MQSKKKPISVLPLEELGIDIQSQLKTLKVNGPEKRSAGVKIGSIKELVQKLKQEAQVIS